jgi:hypothetical protein
MHSETTMKEITRRGFVKACAGFAAVAAMTKA